MSTRIFPRLMATNLVGPLVSRRIPHSAFILNTQFRLNHSLDNKSRKIRPTSYTPPSIDTNTKQDQKSNDQPKREFSVKFKILVVLAGLTGATTLLRMVFGKERLPETSIESAFDPTPNTMASSAPSTSPAFPPNTVSVVFVLGGPGAGKGTQCARLVEDYSFVHLSAGDLLRAEQARPDSQYGQLIADYIKGGLIVPQEITIKLLENAMKEAVEKQKKTRFLIDGFPRKMDQAFKFEETVSESKLVLFLNASEEVMEARLLKRGETSGRSDDNIESIKKRFKTFRETSMPVVEHYEKLGKVVSVDTNNPVDQVYNDVKKGLKEKKIIE